MSSSSSTSYRRWYSRNQDVIHKTHCDCDPPHPIPVQSAWTIDNPSRRFKRCPIRDKGKKYGVYGFLDLELPGEYYKQLVYNLHKENKALKKNKMCGVMEDSSKGYSNYSINQQMVKDLKAEIIVISSSSEDISDNQSEGNVTKVNERSSKRKLPPLGSAERPRPEVTPHVAKILKYRSCPP
ncbi:hypothetical protein Tco_1395391 [Tanacetum coccineum]